MIAGRGFAFWQTERSLVGPFSRGVAPLGNGARSLVERILPPEGTWLRRREAGDKGQENWDLGRQDCVPGQPAGGFHAARLRFGVRFDQCRLDKASIKV